MEIVLSPSSSLENLHQPMRRSAPSSPNSQIPRAHVYEENLMTPTFIPISDPEIDKRISKKTEEFDLFVLNPIPEED